jgi:hypothetical protein
MSLEAKIEALTMAVIALTAKMQESDVEVPVAPAPAPAAPPPNVPPTVPPVTAPFPESSGAPFADAKGLMQYVMEAYKTLGRDKGAQIQTVLNNMGCQNVNDIKVEQYAQLYAGVEALKK